MKENTFKYISLILSFFPWILLFSLILFVLNRFIPICEQRQDMQRVQRYQNLMEELKKALNTSGWDGRWYRRAYTDDGQILGSIENEEC